jgi:hypothetical protein
MNNILIITGGVFWLIVYVEIISKGFQDKTYGMPIAALLVNISWEFINSFVYSASGPQLYVNFLWLLLDLIIMYQLLRYWKNEFEDISPLMFYSFLIVSLLTAYFFIIIFAKEFGFTLGSFYTAFGNNLMISVLFLSMLYRRKSLRGQSIYIAVFKMLGTLAQVGAYYNFTPEIHKSLLLKFLYISIFIFDLIYFILVYLQAKKNLLFPVEDTA